MSFPDLTDRNIIVTGAGGGVGQTLCHMLAESGARVTATVRPLAHRQAPPDDLVALGAAVRVVAVDVSDGAEVRALCDEAVAFAGPIWGLVNLVGGYSGGPMLGETTLDDVRRMWTLNTVTAFNCCHEVLPRLVAAGLGGRIVNVGSAAADRGTEGHFPYGAAKSAVHHLTEVAAAEYGRHGITANTILPGMIATPANLAGAPTADASRWATPRQVGEVVRFLLSDAADGVNGAAIRVTARG